MTSLTDEAETRTANYLAGKPVAGSAPVLPFKVALVTALGSDAAVGTEVVGGSYVRQSVDFGQLSSGDTIKNTALVRFDNMPAATVVGIDIYDSTAGTPVRWFYGALTASKTLVSGDPLEFAMDAITIRTA